ncbi:MAG: hypothetical protein RSB09_03030 [Clostridia bacterium]
MNYQRKTIDEYILLTNYGYGWDEEVFEETYLEIKQRAKEYLLNTNAQIKIIKRRKAIKEKLL